MSNRIDLTQFKRVFDGGHPKHLFEKVERRFKDGGVRTTPLYLGPQDVDAITLLPELIAELKRCYEELDEANKVIDVLWDALDNWEICWDDYSMHSLYDELDEKYAQDDDGRIVLKELYSYTEEDGWQLKEPASE